MIRTEYEGRHIDREFLLYTDPASKKELGHRLSASQGIAAIIVHPYYPQKAIDKDWYTGDGKEAYSRYLTRLNRSIEKYERRNLPLILFEETSNTSKLPDIVEQLGVKKDTVFVVPTEVSNAKPFNYSWRGMTSELRNMGLRKAIVSGSYLWTENLSYMPGVSPGGNRPNIVSKFFLAGCAGVAINNLLEGGIYVTPGYSTFPRTSHGESGLIWE